MFSCFSVICHFAFVDSVVLNQMKRMKRKYECKVNIHTICVYIKQLTNVIHAIMVTDSNTNQQSWHSGIVPMIVGGTVAWTGVSFIYMINLLKQHKGRLFHFLLSLHFCLFILLIPLLSHFHVAFFLIWGPQIHLRGLGAAPRDAAWRGAVRYLALGCVSMCTRLKTMQNSMSWISP